MTATPMIEAKDLCCTYVTARGLFARSRRHVAVTDLSLRLDRGTCYGLIGESGSGKSTVAAMLLGLTRPTSGQILIDGKLATSMSQREIARHVQPVFQDPYSSLNPRWCIGDSVALPLKVHGKADFAERRRRSTEILGQVGIPRHYYERYPSELSGGQRQRVAIARALVTKPEVVVCDEPTSALDVSVQGQILNLLADLQREYNLTLLLISHNLAVVEHMASRVGVMLAGQMVEEADTNAIFNAPRHEYTRRLLSAVLLPDVVSHSLDPRTGGST